MANLFVIFFPSRFLAGEMTKGVKSRGGRGRERLVLSPLATMLLLRFLLEKTTEWVASEGRKERNAGVLP
jgi:hypothetical protein